VVGPWAHDMNYKFPAFDFGPTAGVAVRRLQLEWFNYWLRPAGQGSEDTPPGPPLRIFVMGVNRWRDEREWPLARARDTAFYLSSDGQLQAKLPGRSAPDRFTYDPRKPAPTMGGAVCCDPKIFPWGPMDQRLVEKRRDVLVYSSGALKQNLEATGVIRVVLWASTTAPDTDFTAKLVDVFPDGRAVNLTDGILRLRYRESLERPTLAVPGRVYALGIDAGVTSNVFLKGHRIRVEISSSNFPRFDRNPNTGGPLASETRFQTATQTIYHDAQHPSRIILPVVP
jgi:putative CocE/NonD family hydrolase